MSVDELPRAAERVYTGRGGAVASGAGGTRERLVVAAGELLAMDGPQGVTLRAVGDRAQVSRSAAYRHFTDKQDLLAAVAAEAFRRLERRMAAAMAGPVSDPAVNAGGTRLQRGCVAYIEFGLAEPHSYLLMFGAELGGREDEVLDAAVQSAMALFFENIVAGQAAGDVQPGDVREIASLIWAFMHGLVDLALSGHLTHKKGVDVATAAPALVATLLASLAP